MALERCFNGRGLCSLVSFQLSTADLAHRMWTDIIYSTTAHKSPLDSLNHLQVKLYGHEQSRKEKPVLILHWYPHDTPANIVGYEFIRRSVVRLNANAFTGLLILWLRSMKLIHEHVLYIVTCFWKGQPRFAKLKRDNLLCIPVGSSSIAKDLRVKLTYKPTYRRT